MIDDQVDHQALFQTVLESEGYRVSIQRDAEADLIKRLMPDLIILDLVFNGQPRGMTLLREPRANPMTATTPVIVCSAAVSALARLEGWPADGISRLGKPFDLDELLATVARYGRPNGATEEPWEETIDMQRMPTTFQSASATILAGHGVSSDPTGYSLIELEELAGRHGWRTSVDRATARSKQYRYTAVVWGRADGAYATISQRGRGLTEETALAAALARMLTRA